VDCWLLVRAVVTSVFVSGGAAGSLIHNEGKGCVYLYSILI